MLNRCEFIGRLGQDPEKRYTANGKAVTNFTVAVSEKYNGKEETQWIPCFCWEKTADFVAEYLQKGALVYVAGKWQTRSWDDKDGNKRYKTELSAQTVQNLSPRNESKPEPQEKAYQTSGDNEVPF